MFDKIQMIVMMKTFISNNSISRLKYRKANGKLNEKNVKEFAQY